jgi:hypothetical protein
LRDLSQFVNRLPVTNETKNQIYNTLVKIVRGSLSIDDTIEELKHIEIVPINQCTSGETSYDELRLNTQQKLNELLDQFWGIVDQEHEAQIHELCQNMREIFNNLFHILSQQEKKMKQLENEINYMKIQMEALQIPSDELLLGSLATQLIIKMSRFERSEEHPSIAACRSISTIMQVRMHQSQFRTGDWVHYEGTYK